MPHKKIKTTSFELWKDLGYFKVLGYLNFIRFSDPKRPKLGARVTTCIFLIYG